MPIFEYKCEKCGFTKEVIIINVSISGYPAKKRCDKCAGMMTRVPTAHAKTAGKWLV